MTFKELAHGDFFFLLGDDSRTLPDSVEPEPFVKLVIPNEFISYNSMSLDTEMTDLIQEDQEVEKTDLTEYFMLGR